MGTAQTGTELLRNYVGGEWVEAEATKTQERARSCFRLRQLRDELTRPIVKAISFMGSSKTASYEYGRAAASGKQV
jgi:hypothetical protein